MSVVPQYVTAKTIAQQFAMSVFAVYAAAREGVIPSYRLGRRRIRFRVDEVAAALRRQQAPAPEPEPEPASPIANSASDD
jgi:excisionase family DNA binding protein